MSSNWEVLRSREYKEWSRTLSKEEQAAVYEVLKHLQAAGPALRRPLSGPVEQSRFRNMKELIIPQGRIRILYAFSPDRQAILLLGGDKTDNWRGWYDDNVPIADRIFERYLNRGATNTKRPAKGAKRK